MSERCVIRVFQWLSKTFMENLISIISSHITTFEIMAKKLILTKSALILAVL